MTTRLHPGIDAAVCRPDPTPAQFAAWQVTHPPMMGAETPPGPTAAQPPAGEPGAQGRGDVDHLQGLYDLQSAPEHLRPQLQDELRKINAGLSRRFQEHTEFRQRYEPLEQIEGLSDVPAEDLSDLIAVREMIVAASNEQSPDDEALYDWWQKLGEHFEFFGDDGSQPSAGGEPEGDETPPWARQLIERQEGLEQRLEGFDKQTSAQAAKEAVDAELKQLAEKHQLDEGAEARVLQLAYAYGGAPDALQKGLADYFEITGQAENGLLDNGRQRPGPSTPPGGQPPGPTGEKLRFGDPRLKQAARARIDGTNAGAAT